MIKMQLDIGPKSPSPKKPHVIKHHKKLHLARTRYVVLLSMEPAERCCGPLTMALKSQYRSQHSGQLTQLLIHLFKRRSPFQL